MPLGPLATLVATMPGWLDLVVNHDEIDINPPGGPKFKPQDWSTRTELLEQFEASLKKGREVLKATSDDHLLNTNWRMLSAGKVMSDQPRLYRDPRRSVQPFGSPPRPNLPCICGWNEAKVPAIYGPSADEGIAASGGTEGRAA